jgi:hypothetical protein
MKKYICILVYAVCFGCSEKNDLLHEYYNPAEIKQLHKLIDFTKNELSKNCNKEKTSCMLGFFDQFKDLGANQDLDIPISVYGELKLLRSIDPDLFNDIWVKCKGNRSRGKDKVTQVEKICLNPDGRFVQLLIDAKNRYPHLENYGSHFEVIKDYTPAMNALLLKYPETFNFESNDELLIVAIHILTLNYPEQ